jgi:hypothetical protein
VPLLIHEGMSLGELRRMAEREEKEVHRKEEALDENSPEDSSAPRGESAE